VSITHHTHRDLAALDRAPVWLNAETLKAEELCLYAKAIASAEVACGGCCWESR
jgi:hypothetical protein